MTQLTASQHAILIVALRAYRDDCAERAAIPAKDEIGRVQAAYWRNEAAAVTALRDLIYNSSRVEVSPSPSLPVSPSSSPSRQS